jgi:hypothetical protein
MALKSLRVTKKEIQNYYSPKTSDYEMMVNSINSPMGYGQIIQSYNSTETGVEVTNTYYHVYNYEYGGPIVIDKTSGAPSSIADAGPTFWGVGSNVGVDFLNGTVKINGLRKLKYCDGCYDGNGLNKTVVDNFSKRFRQLSELVNGYNLLEGFLFYDLTLPRYSNVFPSIKVDDGVNIEYKFKNVNTGADLTPADVSQITGEPISSIESSVDTAPIIKPQEGANTVITSCCDESIFYVISGQYTIGNILYSDYFAESFCWYVESLTKDLPNVGAEAVFTDGGRSCKQCVYNNPCPTPCEEMSLGYTEGRTNPISDACSASQLIYEYDKNEGVLYPQGQCGVSKADMGYYSDGRVIYFVDGDGKMNEVGPCETPPPSYFEFVDIFSDNFNEIWSYTNSALQQSWSDVNNFRFMYDTTYVQLSIRIISTYEPPTQGSVFNTPPKENGLSYIDPSNIYGINLGYYLTIGCDINFYPTETTTIPVDVQGNFGDKFNPDWRTIGTFNATIIIPA